MYSGRLAEWIAEEWRYINVLLRMPNVTKRDSVTFDMHMIEFLINNKKF